MRLSKRIFRSRFVQSLLGALLALYLQIVYLTARKIRLIDPAAQDYIDGKIPAIFTFWHGRMSMAPFFRPRGRSMNVLVSLHTDGALIGKVVSTLGVKTIHGSSSRGGSAALRNIIAVLKEGGNIGITPDGPRGPNQVASRGVATIAKQTKMPVLPSAYYATSHKRFKSWDRFLLPLPFTTIIFALGAPIEVQRDDDEETARQQIESAMNQATQQADTHVSL